MWAIDYEDADDSMAKKAVLLLACLVILASQNALPAYAHYTLGRQARSMPFRLGDFDLPGHVPGLTAYVWPGGGLATLDPSSPLVGGTRDPFTAFPPGYQSPFTSYGQPTPQPTQLRGGVYSPFSSILASTADHPSKGDLILAISFTCPEETLASDGFQKGSKLIGCSDIERDLTFKNVVLYVPPEFGSPVDWEKGDTSNIVTTITNDYQLIQVRRNDGRDPFGPFWWTIVIRGEISFSPANQFSEWYYIRLNEMTAPWIAGRYFFKIFVNSVYPTGSTVLETGKVVSILTGMPAENWPVLLVKGEVNPSMIAGTIRYGDFNPRLHNRPIQLPGRVRAVGIATDPLTGSPTGRTVEAWGFFNASARGHYEVEGVAPGIYDIFASAGGFPEEKVAEQVAIREGQLVQLDFQLRAGPTVSGELMSSDGLSEHLWPTRRPVLIEIFDDNSWDRLGDPVWEQMHLKAFSPVDLAVSPYSSYVLGATLWITFSKPFDTPPTPKRVSFPWEGPVNYYSPASDPFTRVSPKDPFGVYNGVGPAQIWWVDPTGFPTIDGDPDTLSSSSTRRALGSTPSRFRWQFGAPRFYGAPADFDGHVPQVFATWTGGLTPGKYFLRAWVTQYLQTDVRGAFVDYELVIDDDDSPRDVVVPVVLRLGASLDVTVHFRDVATNVVDSSIGGPDPGRYAIAEARDTDGRVVAFNFTYLRPTDGDGTISLCGFGMAGPNSYVFPGGGGVSGMKYSLYRYRGIRDYGIPVGTYSTFVYVRGYIQASIPEASVAVGPLHVFSSTVMYRGGGLGITVFSRDFRSPRMHRNWVWPGAQISIVPYRQDGTRMGLVRYWNGESWGVPNQDSFQSSFPFPGTIEKPTFDGSAALEIVGPDSAVFAGPSRSGAEATADLSNLVLSSGFLWDSGLYRDKFGVTNVALPADLYDIRIFTYGYVQRTRFQAFVGMGSFVDMKLDVFLGLNFTLVVKFRKEGSYVQNPFNMSMRVRIFDEMGQLVAGSATSRAFPAPFSDNWIPNGVAEVRWKLAGFLSYVETNGRSFPSYGVAGLPDYAGRWTVELDAVNWYRPRSFFPPVDGLLLGESYHTLGGSSYGKTGSAYAFNHLGPWEQRNVVEVPSSSLSSETSVMVSIDQRGLVRGVVVGKSSFDEVRPISWAQIRFSTAGTAETSHSLDGFFEAYLNSGEYEVTFSAWTEKGEGHQSVELPLLVSEGSRLTDVHVVLAASVLPVPETPSLWFPALPFVLILALICLNARLRRTDCPRRGSCELEAGNASTQSENP